MASQLADNIPRVDFIQTLVEADLFRILTPVPKTSAIAPGIAAARRQARSADDPETVRLGASKNL